MAYFIAEDVMRDCLQLNVAKANLQDTALCRLALPQLDELSDDCLLVRVERFAFTANNITYAMLGEQLKYWQLFRAPDGFGNIPVWGFGEVIASMHPQIAVGERLFGLFPMASHLLIEAADVSRRGLRDGASHRQGVAHVYNAYARVSSDPAFEGRQGDYQALLRPLFMLSFLVDDFLSEQEFYGARSVVLSSASSKTSFGLAHLLRAKRKPIRAIGLTSAGNADFVASLGCYDDVVTYDRIETLPADQLTAFVDMAGNAELRARLHRHFDGHLVYSGRVGMTHQDASDDVDLPGAQPSWFFAPDQIRKRAREWGPGGIDNRFNDAWIGFMPMVERSLSIVEATGPEAVQHVYREALAGRLSPEHGHMLSLAQT
jgi:hypothetical protein